MLLETIAASVRFHCRKYRLRPKLGQVVAISKRALEQRERKQRPNPPKTADNSPFGR